mmetsp:Transcript_47344/g.135771  ORF Transcript_47344/g.135771 Transcript_47344/m.135771 type:complete len:501 (+) Transcript_47344:1206-2708(+)
MIERRRGQRQQLQPVLRNALRLEAVDEGLLHVGGVETLVLHEQPAVRHLSHDPCPERDARLGDLGEATETAERHVAVLQCRECVYVRDAHRGSVAEEDAGHPDELLAVGLLGLDGVHDAVGDAVVDGAEPRRVVVANVGALHRCRLQRADVQAVVGSVPSELHQDVDSIRTDDLGDLLRRFPCDLLPVRVRHETLEKLRLLVLPSGGGVKENLEEVPVVVLEEGVAEEGHRVVEVVGRNVADAQFPVHRARHGPLGVRGAQLPAEALRPGAVRLEDPIWIDLVQVVQRQEPVLSRVLRGRRQLDASFVHSQGLVQVAVVPEQPAQVVVGLRIGRRDGHGAREVLQRLCQLTDGRARHTEVVQGLGEARVALQGQEVALQRLVQVLLLLVEDAHVVVGLCAPGVEEYCEVVVDERLVMLSQLRIQHTQVVVRIGIRRSVNKGLPVALDCPLRIHHLELQTTTHQTRGEGLRRRLAIWPNSHGSPVPLHGGLEEALGAADAT